MTSATAHVKNVEPTKEANDNGDGVPLAALIGGVIGAVIVTAIAATFIVGNIVKRRFAKISDRTANFDSLYSDRPVGGLGMGTKLIMNEVDDDEMETMDDEDELLGGL